MKILDNLAINIANRINAKNDEVMLLTQENEQLKRDYDAKAYTVKQLNSKSIDQESIISDLLKTKKAHEKEIEHQKKSIIDLAEKGEVDGETIKEYAEENINLKLEVELLESKKCDSRLKETINELKKYIKKIEKVADANAEYRETYEHISNEKNRQSVMDNFGYNLDKYLTDKKLSNVKAAEKFDSNDSAIHELRKGKRAVNVNTIQKFDIELCEYFECSVCELVTVKLNKEVSQ